MSRRKRKKYKQIRHQRYVTRKVYKTRRRRHRGRSSSHRKVHYSAQSKANKHKHYCPRNSFNISKSNKLIVTHQN